MGKVYKLAPELVETLSKPTVNEIISAWASEGFDEKTKPYASGWGKGVFHQKNPGFYVSDKLSEPEEYSFDFGSASKAKALEELNKRLKPYKVVVSAKNANDDSGNDFIRFEKLLGE